MKAPTPHTADTRGAYVVPLKISEAGTVQFPMVAHAVEIGWTPISPDEARTKRGGDAGTFLRDVLEAKLAAFNPWLTSDAVRSLVETLDALPPTIEGNRELLAWLGWRDIDWRGLILLLIAGLAGVGLALALWNRRKHPGARDPLGRSYARFCARLAAIGLARQASEGPLAYGARIAKLRPDLADATGPILGLYAQLRYGERPDPRRLRELHAHVRRFRPRA